MHLRFLCLLVGFAAPGMSTQWNCSELPLSAGDVFWWYLYSCSLYNCGINEGFEFSRNRALKLGNARALIGTAWNTWKDLKRDMYTYISFYLSLLWFSRSSGFTHRGHWCDPGSSVPTMTARCHKTSLWHTWYDLSVFQFWDEKG